MRSSINRFVRKLQLFGLMIICTCYSNHLLSHGVADDRIASISERIKAKPNDPTLYVKRGRIQADIKHWHDALFDYEKALTLDPNYHEARYWMGLVYTHKKEWKKAQQVLRKYITAKPDSAAGYETLADVLVQTQQWRKAASYYDQAISKSTTTKPQTYINRAQALMRLSPLPLEEVEQGLTQGIKVHGNLVSYLDVAFQASWQSEKFSNALRWITQLPKSVQQTPEWLLKKAQVYEKKGDKKRAIKTYQSLITKMDQLPRHRRNIPAWRTIREESEQALIRLGSG